MEILKKKGEIVKFHNDLNQTKFKDFNLYDYKIFFTICSKLLEKGEEQVKIDFMEFKEILDLTKKKTVAKKYLENLLIATDEKLGKIKFNLKSIVGAGKFTLFPGFFIPAGTTELYVQVHPLGKYLLNNLVKNFTLANLQIMNSLKSKYSYRLYLQLKQFENIPDKNKIEKNGKLYCWRNFEIENFREIMDIPESYTMKDINKRILKVAVEEIREHFEEIDFEKTKKGKNITNIIFYFNFKKEDNIELLPNTEISELEEYFNLTFITTKYTKDIKNKLEELEKKHSIKYIKKWLEETWVFISENSAIKNKDAYFANLIVAGASPISSKKKEELDRLDKIEKKAQEYVNIIVPFGTEEEEEQRGLYKNVFSFKNEEDIKESKIKKIGDLTVKNSKIELEKEEFEVLRKEYIEANLEKCMKEKKFDKQFAEAFLGMEFSAKYTIKKEE